MMRQIDRLPGDRAILRSTPPMEWTQQTDFALVEVINQSPIMGCDEITAQDREEAMEVFLSRYPLLSDLGLPFHDVALAHRRATDRRRGCMQLEWLASEHQGLRAWLTGIAAWPELHRAGLRKTMEALARLTSPTDPDCPVCGDALWALISTKYRDKKLVHINYRKICVETVALLGK